MTGNNESLKTMTPNAGTQSEYYTFENDVAISDISECFHDIFEPFFHMRGQGRPKIYVKCGFLVFSLSANDVLVFENRDNIARFRPCCRYHISELSSARSLFHFPGNTPGTRKEYAGRKLVGYSAGQMFDVVADVEHYHTFVPFCKKSEIKSKDANGLRANLVIGFPPIIESYTSHVTLVRPHLVKAVCTDGKLFNHLLTTWKFTPGLKNNSQTCIIDFYVSFDFNSPLYSHLANIFFNELVRQMESAFYDEAKSRYGKPSIKTIQLRI